MHICVCLLEKTRICLDLFVVLPTLEDMLAFVSQSCTDASSTKLDTLVTFHQLLGFGHPVVVVRLNFVVCASAGEIMHPFVQVYWSFFLPVGSVIYRSSPENLLV